MNIMPATMARRHSTLLVALGLAVGAAGTAACDGCGQQTDDETTDVAEDTESGDGFDGLDMQKAKDEAEQAGEMAAVRRSDRARIVSGNVEARQRPSGGGGGESGGGLETGGTIDVTLVKQVFKDHDEQAQKCYERALKQNPNLQGKVNLKVTIDTDGTVARVDARGNTLRSESVNSCLESAAREWQFPEPEGGAKVVNKPYNFSPRR